ncbi:ATP/GTP-binding protein [Kineococcus sp. NUM-3379]
MKAGPLAPEAPARRMPFRVRNPATVDDLIDDLTTPEAAPGTAPGTARGTVPGTAAGAPAREPAAPPDPDAAPARRRGLLRRRTAEPDPGQGGAGEARPGELELPEPQGFGVRASFRRARRGWYAPLAAPALTTTRQAEVLNTAIVAAPTDPYGIIIGRDRLSNTPVAHDPFTAYEKGEITSPAVVVLGVVGAGKSSLLKTVYVMRPLILRNRRVVVMDKKDRGGQGEYAELTREFGTEPLRFVVGGGGTTLNILDPTVLAGSGVAGQARLLSALAELANNGVPLDAKRERPALRAALRATLQRAEADGRVPVLADLLPRLGEVHAEFSDHSPSAREKIHQAGLNVRHLLSALLSDELSGLFDGHTSPNVRLSERLTTFDISQLPDESPAVSMVMAVANVWLLGTLRSHRGLRTNFIAEEGWDLVGGPGGRVFQRNSKLARGLGLSNIAALHHIADIPEHDPAVAMLKEAQTVHLYRQDRAEDIDACIRMYNLDRGARHTLANLESGHHLLKIGNRREIHVEHVRSRLERGLTDTDEAMVSGPGGRRL